MPPPAKGPKCHPCVRNTVLPISQEVQLSLSQFVPTGLREAQLRIPAALTVPNPAVPDQNLLRSDSVGSSPLVSREAQLRFPAALTVPNPAAYAVLGRTYAASRTSPCRGRSKYKTTCQVIPPDS